MSLDALPPDMLRLIMRQLAAVDLAALSMQNKYLRVQAAENDLWKSLLDGRLRAAEHVWTCASTANCRWPDCCTAAKYPSCKAAYSMRAAMPGSLALYVDRIAKLRYRMGDDTPAPSQSIFEDTMRTLHMLGPLLDLAPAELDIRRTAEHSRLISDLCTWLKQQPGVAIAFVHTTTQLVHDGSGASLQVRWRRSSVAVLARLLRRTPCQALHPSVFEALRSATARLDHSMQRSRLPAAVIAAPQMVHAGCWQSPARLGAFESSLSASPSLVAAPA